MVRFIQCFFTAISFFHISEGPNYRLEIGQPECDNVDMSNQLILESYKIMGHIIMLVKTNYLCTDRWAEKRLKRFDWPEMISLSHFTRVFYQLVTCSFFVKKKKKSLQIGNITKSLKHLSVKIYFKRLMKFKLHQQF